MVEDQAQWYMQWQGDSLALHSKITESAAAMAHASEGIRTATDFFEAAQHRSQNALAVLVGRRFSRNDVLFLTGSIMVFVAMGWHHATQQKRLAFVASLLVTVGLERSIISWLEPWQRVCTCCFFSTTAELDSSSIGNKSIVLEPWNCPCCLVLIT